MGYTHYWTSVDLNYHCQALGKDLQLASDGTAKDWFLGQRYAQEATGYELETVP